MCALNSLVNDVDTSHKIDSDFARQQIASLAVTLFSGFFRSLCEQSFRETILQVSLSLDS